MKINKAGIDLIKEFEGCSLTAYKCPAGVWTIGYGLTTAAGLRPVGAGTTITQAEAEEYLDQVLTKFGNEILPYFNRQPTPNQYAAFVSLAYNIGPNAFRKSTALRRFNAGDLQGAAAALQWFNKAGGKVLRGLTRRRSAEAKLFLSGVDLDVEGADVRPDAEKTAGRSTTLAAAAAAAASGATGVSTAVSQLDSHAQTIVVVAACIAGLALIWIIRERIKRLADGV